MVAFTTFLFSSAPSSVANPQLGRDNDNPQERIEYPQHKTEKNHSVECGIAKKDDDFNITKRARILNMAKL